MGQLENVIAAMPIIQQLSVLDCSITVCNAAGTIVSFLPASSFQMKGQQVKGNQAKIADTGALAESLKNNVKSQRTVSRDVFGIPVKLMAVPIHDEGRLVGAIGIALNLATQSTLQDAIQTIAATSQEVDATVQELAAGAANLADKMEDLRGRGAKIIDEIKKTDRILSFVSDVATNSKLLSVNASIEAARAGESGRGFAVVADEIGKMAQGSDQAVKNIREILHTIQQDSKEIVSTITDTTVFGERQAAATEEITATMHNLAQAAVNIEKIAEII